MKIKLNPKFIIAFLSLTFAMHEAHEIAHTSVGRIICGCWGVRDFNVWETCAGCSGSHLYFSTLAGPLFTFAMIWIGAFLMKSNNSDQQKTLGFALIFANMPFGRIFNPIFGGGDEVMVVNVFLDNWNLSGKIALALIILITAYPLYKAFAFIKNKYRIGWFLIFLLAPFVIDLLIILGVMNTLISNGILSQYWILGSPMLVTVWTITVSLTFLFTRKGLYTLTRQ